MGYDVIALVLLAALLHAGWNAMVKVAIDRLALMALLSASASAISLAAIPWLPLPAPASWPYLAASTALHVGYQVFLIAAYRHGDLAQVYPIARGGAPVLVTLVTVGLLGQALPPLTLAGICSVTIGIMCLSLRSRRPWFRGNGRAIGYALGTAGFIAGYTLCDGFGVRAAENPHSYTAWLFLIEGPPIILIAAIALRGRLVTVAAGAWPRGVAAGAMSLAAYWLVLWALSLGAIAPVATLRETSVVFAALIGSLFLKESMTRWRLLAVTLVACGIILLKL